MSTEWTNATPSPPSKNEIKIQEIWFFQNYQREQQKHWGIKKNFKKVNQDGMLSETIVFCLTTDLLVHQLQNTCTQLYYQVMWCPTSDQSPAVLMPALLELPLQGLCFVPGKKGNYFSLPDHRKIFMTTNVSE
jgi:hypothetical protein